eukprot:5575732-Heterocapsa_arctica.AAC.1
MQFRAVAALRNLVGEIRAAQSEAAAHRAAQSAAPDTEPTPMEGVESEQAVPSASSGAGEVQPQPAGPPRVLGGNLASP